MTIKVFGMVSTVASAAYTLHALKSFFAHTALEADDQFLLIDNDGSLQPESVFEISSRLSLLSNSKPESFARNMNSILRSAREREADAFLLNNDLIFAPDWLAPLLQEREALYSPVCNMQLSYQTGGFACRLTMELADYLGHEADFLNVVKHHRTTARGYRLTHSVPYYCMRIPRAVYLKVGELDESYGLAGWEDTDYTVRCYLQGIPIFFAMGSFILHFYGKSTWQAGAPGEEKQRLKIENNKGEELFAKKWGRTAQQIFGLLSEEGMAQLRVLEEKALIDCYGAAVRSSVPR